MVSDNRKKLKTAAHPPYSPPSPIGCVLEAAVSAISTLLQSRALDAIPHVFLTNAGGYKEELKAHHLTEKLQLAIHHSRVLLSHSPIKALDLRGKHVLLVGSDDENLVDVARSYSIERHCTLLQYIARHPQLCPNHKVNSASHAPRPSDTTDACPAAIDVIALLSEPADWGLALQVFTP